MPASSNPCLLRSSISAPIHAVDIFGASWIHKLLRSLGESSSRPRRSSKLAKNLVFGNARAFRRSRRLRSRSQGPHEGCYRKQQPEVFQRHTDPVSYPSQRRLLQVQSGRSVLACPRVASFIGERYVSARPWKQKALTSSARYNVLGKSQTLLTPDGCFIAGRFRETFSFLDIPSSPPSDTDLSFWNDICLHVNRRPTSTPLISASSSLKWILRLAVGLQ